MAEDDDDNDPPDEIDQTTTFSPTSWHGRTTESLNNAPRGMGVLPSDELNRIVALPRRPVVYPDTPMAEALIEMQMRKYSLGERECRCAEIDPNIASGKRECIKRFFWVQAWALHEITVANGLFAGISVGSGKSILDVIGALAFRDCKLALLLVPASLIHQIETDYLLIREHMRVPGFVIHKGEKTTVAYNPPINPHTGLPETATVHVLPYTRLSSIKSSQWIDHIKPDVIIADEIDSLKDMTASRVLRLMRFFDENRATRFAGWTGSPTDNSIKEMAHLSALALRRTLSPLPVEREVIDDWSRCLDAVPNPCPVGALTKLLAPGEGVHMVRAAFHRRLAETPGFMLVGGRQAVVTSAGEPVEINIREKVAPELPPIIADALAKVRANLRPDTLVGPLPDGTEREDEILVDPLEKAKCAREVATGLLYVWEFPPIQGVPQRRETIQEWYRARGAFFSELNRKKMHGEVMLDSPTLCIQAAQRAWGDSPRSAQLPEWRSEHWPHWRDVMDTVKYTPKAHRLDPYIVEDAVRWGIENRGIIWYSMSEFATWAVEKSREWGYPMPMFGQGSGALLAKETGERSIIASIKSHGRGFNGLQYWAHRQIVINTLASARMWQQVAGRSRRRGQENAEIELLVYLHTDELRKTFDQALRRARYVTGTTAEEQELLLGWDGPDNEDG